MVRALLGRGSVILAVAAVAGGFFLPPEGLGIPFCWTLYFFGLPCPGCGLLRSMANMSHGDLGHAMRYHPFGPPLYALFCAVIVAALGGAKLRAAITAVARNHPHAVLIAYWSFFGSFLLFGAVRTAFAIAGSEVVPLALGAGG